jgi:hypothetical protein
MNCTNIQQRLLASEHLARLPAEVQDHLRDCPACRSWHQRALSLEQQVRSLPVPPSRGPGAFVQKFLTGDPAVGPDGLPWWVQSRPRRARRPNERLRLRVALAFAMAAGLAIFALGWWAWPQPGPREAVAPVVPDRAAERLARIQERLHGTRTAGERVERLADLAEELQGEAKKAAESGDAVKLAEAAQFYTQVVQDHLLFHADAVPVADRHEVLGNVAMRLRRTESEASRRATELRPAAETVACEFDHIASAAGDASSRLAKMAGA